MIGTGRLGVASAGSLGFSNPKPIPTTFSKWSALGSLALADARPIKSAGISLTKLSQELAAYDTKTIVYESEEQLSAKCKTACWAGVVLYDGDGVSSNGWNYSIRFQSKGLSYFPNIDKGLGGVADVGIVTLQLVLDRILMKYSAGGAGIDSSFSSGTSIVTGSQFTSINKADYTREVVGYLYDFIATTGSVCFLVLFLPHVFWIVNGIVLEKELRIKEAMTIMGLKVTTYYAAWLLFISVLASVSFVIIGVSLYVILFPNSDILTCLLLVMVSGLGLIAFAFLCSNFFVKARLAGLSAIAITFFAGLGITQIGSSFAARAVNIILLPPTTIVYGIIVLSRSEQYSKPTTVLTWGSSNTEGIAFIFILIFGLIGAALYGTLAWYLDQVYIPDGGLGTPKHPLFFLGYKWKEDIVGGNDSRMEMTEITSRSGMFQELPQQENVSIRIRGLTKKFRGSSITSVNNLNLDLVEGQILSLLGKNGCGKTTTIGMLSGMIPVSSGGAYIHGRSILSDISEIRKEIGFCPQHDILWDNLTVYQTLEIYAGIKGIPRDEIDSEITKWLECIGIPEKRNAEISSLSGGQKRKVSICIAFMGGSKIIFLDEPTAGVDPYSRRAMWKVITDNKAGRTIILTTHFLDEADILADRVAIMDSGDLKAVGTSLFLRDQIGLGYQLTVSIANSAELRNGHMGEYLLAVVSKIVNSVELASSSASEVILRIPPEANRSLSSVFKELETIKAHSYITGYGLSMITLHDVFLRLVGAAASDDEGAAEGTIPVDDLKDGLVKAHYPTFISQYTAMLWKRLIIARLDWKVVFIPFLITIIGAAAVGIALKGKDASFCPTSIEQTFPRYDLTDLGSPFTLYVNQSTEPLFPITGFKTIAGSLASMKDVSTAEANNLRPAIGGAFFPTETFSSISLAYDINKEFSASAITNLATNAIWNKVLGKAGASPFIRSTIQAFPAVTSPFESTGWTVHMVAAFVVLVVASVTIPMVSNLVIIKERESRCKEQQRFSVAFSVALSTLKVWNIPVSLTFLMFFLSGVATDLLSFIFTFYFSVSSTGLMTVFGYLFLAAIGVFTGFVVQITSTSDQSYSIADYISLAGFIIDPAFTILYTIFLGTNFVYIQCQKDSKLDPKSSWDIKQLGLPIYILCAQIVIFTIIIFILENWDAIQLRRMASKIKNRPLTPVETGDPHADQDSDVKEEQRRIIFKTDISKDKVVVENLIKQYGVGGKVAVNDVSLGVKEKECFILLGTNGAGKTSMLKIICGQNIPTAGSVTVNNHSVLSDLKGVQKSIGVTPQFDAQWDQLTPKQHLQLYAAIRGVPFHSRAKAVEWLLQHLDLKMYEHVPARALSGGNRRKLSLAMALVGAPDWDVIIAMRSKMAMILTTHSMEEAESLSAQRQDLDPSRIGVMVGGELSALGTLQHLQTKYGNAYQLQAVSHSSDGPELLVRGLQKRFGQHNVKMLEQHLGSVRIEIQIGNGDVLLSSLFDQIKNYQIGQTSLEQIFIQLTARDNERSHEGNSRASYWKVPMERYTWVAICFNGFTSMIAGFLFFAAALSMYVMSLCLLLLFPVGCALAERTAFLFRTWTEIELRTINKSCFAPHETRNPLQSRFETQPFLPRTTSLYKRGLQLFNHDSTRSAAFYFILVKPCVSLLCAFGTFLMLSFGIGSIAGFPAACLAIWKMSSWQKSVASRYLAL
ncbi:hypothetical protein HDU97_003997 [Phlyctochytrium planicorne]|nr:hypothetical protein HDU97_003997 [Phlyctochytrium planicorne]